MLEFIILLMGMTVSFLVGNIIGYESGKSYVEKQIAKSFKTVLNSTDGLHVEAKRARNESSHVVDLGAHRDARSREHMIDMLSRHSLAYSEEDNNWIKVYDAEVIDE